MEKVEIKHLSKRYPAFELSDVSFSIPKGYVTGFIGRNGMGKTTSIKSILSLIHYDGQVDFDIKSFAGRRHNQNIGVIMDDSFLAKDWNISLVNEAMKVGYDKWDENIFWTYIEHFAIDRNLKVRELSRGMKIKLMLAIALSHSANLLILDEPTSGLDPSMRAEFVDIISSYMEDNEHTVLFSTHITQDLEDIADYIVFIDDGRIVLSMEKDDFVDYFMIVKADIDRLKDTVGFEILGQKVGKYSVEMLVKRESVDRLSEGFVEDDVSIERIMILYGRDK